VVIVGGGPHGLALLSALHEKSFAFSQFSDASYQTRVGFGSLSKIGSVCVVDPGTAFLDDWHKRFDALGIEHLRSPALAHPKAHEPHALVNFAVREGRTGELHHVPDATAQRLTTDGNSQQPLLLGLPSTALFRDFCADLAEGLPHQWLRGKATRVHKDEVTGKFHVHYSTHDNKERVVTAEAVALATGPSGQANIPEPFRPLVGLGSVLHTSDLFRRGTLPDTRAIGGRVSRVLVIGGGLTAVQAALAAVKGGSRVVLRSRRPLRTRAYDIASEWLDVRHMNRLRFEFLSTHPEERALFARQAVQGGSVPESYMRELYHIADTTDCLDIQTDEDVERSQVSLIDQSGGGVRVNGEEFNSIILATGVSNAPLQLPLYQGIQAELGAPDIDGLPHVDESLRWAEGHDLFVLGANAVLELGPGALNLMGAMRGAKIVASELRDLMWATTKGKCKTPNAASSANMFSLLGMDDEEGSEDDDGESGEGDATDSSDDDNDNYDDDDDDDEDEDEDDGSKDGVPGEVWLQQKLGPDGSHRCPWSRCEGDLLGYCLRCWRQLEGLRPTR
jgi:lysine/ornithine N-monooxygenase